MPGGRPKGSKNKEKIIRTKPEMLDEHFKPDDIIWLKQEVIRLFDEGEVETLSQAGEILGVSKLKLYSWRRKDESWREQIAEARQLIADKLIEEIQQPVVNGKNISMPYVTARLFLIKEIRPEYRDSYKFVVEDSKTKEHLDAIRKMAEKNKNDTVTEKGG